MFRVSSRLLLVCTCLSVSALPSYAADRLTRDSIQEYYDVSTKVQLKGGEETMAFFKKHIGDEAKITVNATTYIKGQEPAKETVTHSKGKVLQATQAGYKAGYPVKLKSTIVSVDIAQDGRSARVKDTSHAIYMLTLPLDGSVGGRSAKFKSEQLMHCDSTVFINSSNIIQSGDAVCTSEILMSEVE
ncbi:MAG: hypothetical protein ACRBDL_04815 [Alphaproteobacteria bacterium]